MLDAIRIQQGLGCQPELARSYVSYARLLNSWKRTDDARRYLFDAIGKFRGMGMARDLAEVAREAPRSGLATTAENGAAAATR